MIVRNGIYKVTLNQRWHDLSIVDDLNHIWLTEWLRKWNPGGLFYLLMGPKFSRPMKRQQSQLDSTFDHKSYQRDVINVKESKHGLDGEHYRMEHALDFGLFLSAAWTPTTVSSCFKSCFEVSRESHDLFSGAATASPSGLLDSSSSTPPSLFASSPLDLRKVTVFLGRWAR